MMNHVFMFSSFSNIENMSKVINALSQSNASFVIHINNKVDITNNSHIRKLINLNNVMLISDRVKVSWGGFSHLQAIIKLMKNALSYSNATYFHLLSDSCYPIKTKEEIYNYFEQNNGSEFIEYTPLPNTEWVFGGLNRIEYYHLHDIIPVKSTKLNWMINEKFMLLQKHLGYKRKIDNRTYYGGSPWWSLSRAAVQYCIDEIEHNPNFYKQYRHSFCYEESCFQTILANSSFKSSMTNDDLRYVDWSARNGNTPANLDETDFEKLLTSTDLFARKFVSPVSDKLRKDLHHHLAHTSVGI